MMVRDIMTKEVISADPGMPITEVARLLFENNLTGMPVLDPESKVVGIVTEYDLMSPELNIHIPTYIEFLQSLGSAKDSVAEQFKDEAKRIANTTAEDVMTKGVITAHPTTSVEMLISLITEHRINPVPVVDEGNILVGIASRADLVKLLRDIAEKDLL